MLILDAMTCDVCFDCGESRPIYAVQDVAWCNSEGDSGWEWEPTCYDCYQHYLAVMEEENE